MTGASYLCPPPLGAHTHAQHPWYPPFTPYLHIKPTGGISAGERGSRGRMCTCVFVCVRGAEQGVERTHLPRYYCQSIIQGNARRAPRGRVHYALTTGSVLVSQPPRVIVCLRLRVCVYLCMCLLASQLNAPSSCVWWGVCVY